MSVVVTSDNFEEELPGFIEKLEGCSFTSFDLEFTGIHGPFRNSKSDDPNSRYLKMIPVAEKYSIIQIGICIYTEISSNSDNIKLDASLYTFYLFPNYSSKDLVMECASVNFLKENNMDFGKWITKGIPFADKKQQEWLKTKYAPPVISSTSAPLAVRDDISLSRPNDKAFFHKQETQLLAYMDNPTEESFLFDNCNGFMRRFIYQYMENKFPDVTIDKNERGQLRASCLTPAQKCEKEEEDKKKREKKFSQEMGFSLVYNALIESKKPICGHNCFFDVCFSLAKLQGPLSSSLSGLKADMLPVSPFSKDVLFDTKYLAHSGLIDNKHYSCYGTGGPAENSALEHLFNAIQSRYSNTQDEKQNDEITYKNLTGVKLDISIAGNPVVQAHDAGYDAFMTGFVFANQLNSPIFDSAFDKNGNKSRFSNMLCMATDLAASKLYMMQSLYIMDLHTDEKRNCFDSHDMSAFTNSKMSNINGQLQDNIVFKNLFHLSFPRETNNQDIEKFVEKVRPYFINKDDEVQATFSSISWCNGESCILVYCLNDNTDPSNSDIVGNTLSNKLLLPENWSGQTYTSFVSEERLKADDAKNNEHVFDASNKKGGITEALANLIHLPALVASSFIGILGIGKKRQRNDSTENASKVMKIS